MFFFVASFVFILVAGLMFLIIISHIRFIILCLYLCLFVFIYYIMSVGFKAQDVLSAAINPAAMSATSALCSDGPKSRYSRHNVPPLDAHQ